MCFHLSLVLGYCRLRTWTQPGSISLFFRAHTTYSCSGICNTHPSEAWTSQHPYRSLTFFSSLAETKEERKHGKLAAHLSQSVDWKESRKHQPLF
ncbi:hypothetical protein GALMADRAFT_1161027 [Galerina marginata CBS 339.88]|uniref:Uncharacterized protein n=1 Tax=Galerina marginata (strain CBS 339.88) TaxID=685588 RepID=A0A067S612_GALM3|nr:hypothetical protein GALMADRAFT_1161027 [Galerina marginata CBS 339.88]